MAEIAILLATYNGERYLGEFLDSLLSQTYQDFICYIHDDGSKDSTLSVLQSYCKTYKDKFVIWDYPATGSSKNNFMSMLKKVNEKYVMLADQDDVWKPKKIGKTIGFFKEKEKNHQPLVVFSDLEVVDERLNIIAPSFMKKMGFDPTRIKYTQLIAENVAAGCTMMLNQSLVQYVNKLMSTDHIRMHDNWIMVVAAVFGRVEFLNESTILYRQHGDNSFGIKKKSSLEKIQGNIHLFLSGENGRSKRKWLSQMDAMAEELIRIPGVPESKLQVLRDLLSIHNENKIKRISFYVRNDFLKNENNLWMLMWV